MNVADARAIVVEHQRWRRGLCDAVQDIRQVGEAIDVLLAATADEASATALVESRHRMPPHCDTCDCQELD